MEYVNSEAMREAYLLGIPANILSKLRSYELEYVDSEVMCEVHLLGSPANILSKLRS